MKSFLCLILPATFLFHNSIVLTSPEEDQDVENQMNYECPIYLMEYDNHHLEFTFPCMHGVCTGCLVEITNHNAAFPCPSCRDQGAKKNCSCHSSFKYIK